MTDDAPAAARKQRLAIGLRLPVAYRRLAIALRLPVAYRRLAIALRLPVAYRRLAIAGWLFYALSWITPTIDGRHLGAEGFFETVRLALWLLTSTGPWAIPLGLGVCFGWLANISIFTKWPTWARALWIAAPWFAFVVVLLSVPVRPSLPQRAAFFLYFYPWAIGIALIHIANIVAARRNPVRGSLR